MCVYDCIWFPKRTREMIRGNVYTSFPEFPQPTVSPKRSKWAKSCFSRPKAPGPKSGFRTHFSWPRLGRCNGLEPLLLNRPEMNPKLTGKPWKASNCAR